MRTRANFVGKWKFLTLEFKVTVHTMNSDTPYRRFIILRLNKSLINDSKVTLHKIKTTEVQSKV